MDSALFETLGSGVLRRCSTQHWGSDLGFWMGRLLLAFGECRGTLRGGSWKPRAMRSRRLTVILRECPRGRPSRPGEASQSPPLQSHTGGLPSGLTSRSKGRQGGAQRICDESSKQEHKTNTTATTTTTTTTTASTSIAAAAPQQC